MAALVQKKLQRIGYKVHCIGTGTEALAKWDSSAFDVLLLDHGLPDMTGLDIVRKLSAKGLLPPIVMITAAGDENIAVKALKLGASDYVVKDVALLFLELLPSAIEQAVARQKLKAENEAAREGTGKKPMHCSRSRLKRPRETSCRPWASWFRRSKPGRKRKKRFHEQHRVSLQRTGILDPSVLRGGRERFFDQDGKFHCTTCRSIPSPHLLRAHARCERTVQRYGPDMSHRNG